MKFALFVSRALDSLPRDHTRACYIYIALEDDSATASNINLLEVLLIILGVSYAVTSTWLPQL